MAPRADKHKATAQASSEVAATETPATETPATETPATETPATETPATETPATETPATETPATETPATETPDQPGPDESVPKVERKEDLLELMRKPVFQTWLNEHATAAEKVLVSGPAGSGWRYNESKRQDAEDFAAALRGLRSAIESASPATESDEE